MACGHAWAQTPRDRQLQDLQAIREGYVQKSQSFAPRDRIKAHQLIDRLESRAGSLTEGQLMVGMMQVAALAGNGQDAFSFGEGGWRPPRRGKVRLLWFADAIVIARAAPAYRDLLGARVTRIDGMTPSDLLGRLRAVDGGTKAYRRWKLMWLIETGEGLHAMGLAAAPDRLNLELVLPDGRKAVRRIDLGQRAEVPHGVPAARVWSAEPFAGEAAIGWRAAVEATAEPIYLRDPDRSFRMVDMPTLGGLYVQFRANSDQDGEKIAPFVTAVRARLRADPPKAVVVDLRFDSAGDIGQTRELMRDIAKLAPGRVYVLVDSQTFSAGIVSAAALKHDGGDKVVIVGGRVGDRLRFWSQGEAACAPNSGFCLQSTTGLWDLADGCKNEPGCSGDAFDVKVGDLNPDIRAPLTAKAWLANRDPAMEAVKADLARR